MSKKRQPTPNTNPPQLLKRKFVLFGILLLVVITFTAIFLKHYPLFSKQLPDAAHDLSATLSPLAVLRLNTAKLETVLKEFPELEQEGDELSKLLRFLDPAVIAHVDILLFPDEQYLVLGAVALHGSQPEGVRELLAEGGILASYVEKRAEGRYQFRKEAFPSDYWEGFPIDRYAIALIGEVCLIAPESLLQQIQGEDDIIMNSPVFQFASSLRGPHDIGQLGVRFPRQPVDNFEERLKHIALLEQMPPAEMLVDVLLQEFRRLAKPFAQLQFLALTMAIDDNDRMIRYAQLFRPEVDGSAIFEKIKNRRTEAHFGLLATLPALLEEPAISNSLTFHDNRLECSLRWQRSVDQPVLEAMAEATLGAVFEETFLSGEPNREPIIPSYTTVPHLTPQFEPNTLETDLLRQIETNIFPSSYWSNGDEPTMRMDLDPFSFANQSLTEARYEVLRVSTPDGRDVRQPGKEAQSLSLSFSNDSGTSLSLPVQPGTPAEDLHSALLRFTLSIPSELQIFEFKPGATPHKQEQADIMVAARRIDRDIAEIYSRGSQGVWLFAYDETGKAITRGERISSSSGRLFARFNGIIDKLEVVAAGTLAELTFDIETDLNNGKQLQLPKAPLEQPRTRKDNWSVNTYTAMTEEDLAGLRVEWQEPSKRMWVNQGLRVEFPGPPSGTGRWHPNFSGKDGELDIKGYGYTSGNQFGYELNPEDMQAIIGAYGQVDLTVAGTVERLRFEHKGNNIAQEISLDPKSKMEVTFNYNEIAYRPVNLDIIQVKAYDAQNRRLKSDGSRSEGHTRFQYFWGIPIRVEMDVATDYLERTVDFDLQHFPSP